MLIHRNATQWLPVRRIRGLFALDSIKKKNTEIINMDPVLSSCVGGLYQAATLIPNILLICIPRAKGHADMGIIERDVIRIWKAMFTPSMIRSQDVTLLFTPGNMHVFFEVRDTLGYFQLPPQDVVNSVQGNEKRNILQHIEIISI